MAQVTVPSSNEVVEGTPTSNLALFVAEIASDVTKVA